MFEGGETQGGSNSKHMVQSTGVSKHRSFKAQGFQSTGVSKLHNSKLFKAWFSIESGICLTGDSVMSTVMSWVIT